MAGYLHMCNAVTACTTALMIYVPARLHVMKLCSPRQQCMQELSPSTSTMVLEQQCVQHACCAHLRS